VKYIVGTKFGGPVQNWGRARLKNGGIVVNHGGEGSRIDHGMWGLAWGGNKWRPHMEGKMAP
jgi:hypothetical protein